jgi:hypothetical protein
LTPLLRLSGTNKRGAAPQNRNIRICAAIQSASVCVQLASAYVRCEAPSTATKISAFRTSLVSGSMIATFLPE